MVWGTGNIGWCGAEVTLDGIPFASFETAASFICVPESPSMSNLVTERMERRMYGLFHTPTHHYIIIVHYYIIFANYYIIFVQISAFVLPRRESLVRRSRPSHGRRVWKLPILESYGLVLCSLKLLHREECNFRTPDVIKGTGTNLYGLRIGNLPDPPSM